MIDENLLPHRPLVDPESQRKTKDFFSRFFQHQETHKRPISTTIRRSVDEVSSILGDMQNMPLFLENLEEVESLVDGRYNWRFRNEEGPVEEFTIPISTTHDRGRNGFVWESQDAAGFKYHVAVLLEPAMPKSRGTVARMMVMYHTVAGDLVGVFEKLFGKDADILSKKNLQRLKAFCEIGHVPTTVGQPSGREEDMHPTMKH